MWPLIIIGAYFCASVSGAFGKTPTFHKCCPKNQGLVRILDPLDGELLECLDRESVKSNYSISNIIPLIVGDAVPVEYGNLELSCDQLEPVEAQDIELTTTSEACYDKLFLDMVNGTVNKNVSKMFTCVNNQSVRIPNPKLTLNNIRKCCPNGKSYDTVEHICKNSINAINEESLLKTLNVSQSFIYEMETGLNCKPPKYGVELSEALYFLEVEGSSLKALKKDGKGRGQAYEGEWCVESDYRRPGLVARVCTPDCDVYGAFCIRKCCPVGQHYRVKNCGSIVSACAPDNDSEIPFEISNYIEPLRKYGIGDVLGVRWDLRCPQGKIMLNQTLERDHHELDRHGLLHSPFSADDNYCFETFDSRFCPGGDLHVTAAICFIREPMIKNFGISFWLISISSVCLALTLIVYSSLPELRNIHGKTLICHVSMMLLAFSCLARVQHSWISDKRICTSLGYGVYFGFIAAFAWLNVMCLDIWWTFGSMRTVQPMRKAGSERRRFFWYSLYAWSITITMTLTVFLLDKYPVVSWLDANIGDNMCWFGSVQNSSTDWPHYIFFVIPMGLGTCTNFVLFMMTARHCARVKSEVHRLQAGSVGDRAKKRFRVDRAKYVLTGKLWVVMGAGWVSELASTLTTSPEWLWSVLDLFNELQGVFIFLILIFKPKLYYLIRKRLGLEKPDAQKPGSSARTSSTFLSRTISTDERATMRISQGNNIKLP